MAGLRPFVLAMLFAGCLFAQSKSDEAFALASGLYDRGLFERAGAALEQFLEAHPGDPRSARAALLLGQCAQETGNPERALAAFQRASSGSDPLIAAEAGLRVGELLLSRGKAGDAEAFLAPFAKSTEDPKLLGSLLYYLGEARARQKKDELARETWSRLEQACPDHPLVGHAALGLGDLELRARAFEAAMAPLGRAAAKGNPAVQAEARKLLGLCALRLGRLEDAERALRAAEKAGGELPLDLVLGLAELDAKTGRAKAAGERLAKLRRSRPESATVIEETGARLLAEWKNQANLADSQAFVAALGREALTGELAYWANLLAVEAGAGGDASVDSSALTGPQLLSLAQARAKRGESDAALGLFLASVKRSESSAHQAEARFGAASCLVKLGRTEEARSLLVELLKGDPASDLRHDAVWVLAECERTLGRAKEAVAAYAQCAAGGGGPHALLARLRTAELQLELKDYDSAVQAAEAVVAEAKGSSESASALLVLARAHEAVGRWAEALAAYERFLALAPADARAPGASLGAAWAEVELGRPMDAKRRAAALAQSTPDRERRGEALLLAAQLARSAGAPEETVVFLKDFDAQHPAHPRRDEVQFELACALVQTKAAEAAEPLWVELIKRPRKSPVRCAALYEAAFAADSLMKPDIARERRERLVREYPDHEWAPDCWFRIGEARYASEQFGKAIPAYDQAARHSSGESIRDKALYKKGWALRKLNQPAEAATAFVAVAGLNQSALAAEAAALAAEDLEAAGKKREAAEWYAKAGAGDTPFAAAARLRRLIVLEELREYPTVLTEAPRALAGSSDAALQLRARMALGRSLSAESKWERARAVLEEVCAQSQGELAAEAGLLIGRALLKEDRRQEALDRFLKVTILYAHAPAALAGLEAARLLEADGAKDQALRVLEDVVRSWPDSEAAKAAAQRIKALRSKEVSR